VHPGRWHAGHILRLSLLLFSPHPTADVTDNAALTPYDNYIITNDVVLTLCDNYTITDTAYLSVCNSAQGKNRTTFVLRQLPFDSMSNLRSV
jgi:hypothetical protein